MAHNIIFGPTDNTIFERHGTGSGTITRQDGSGREYTVIFTGTERLLEEDDLRPGQLLGAVLENTDLPTSETDRFFTIIGGYYFRFTNAGHIIERVFGVAGDLSAGFSFREGGTQLMSDDWELVNQGGGNKIGFLNEFERAKNDTEDPGHFGWTLITEEVKEENLRPKSGKPITFSTTCPDITEILLTEGQQTKNTQVIKAQVETDAEIGKAEFTWNWGDGSPLETTTSPSAQHRYQRPEADDFQQNISVTIAAASGCESEGSTEVSIPRKCPAIQSLTAEITNRSETNVEMTFNAVLESNSAPDNYSWDLGEGVVSTTDSPTLVASFPILPGADRLATVHLTLDGPDPCESEANLEIMIPGLCPELTRVELHSQKQTGSQLDVVAGVTFEGPKPAEFHWIWGDGNTETTAEPTTSHTYDLPVGQGAEFSLSVSSSGPAACQSVPMTTSVTVDSPECPELIDLNFREGKMTEDHLSVAFEVTSSEPSPDTYLWDFGDGSTAETTVPMVNHLFTRLVGDTEKFTVTVTSNGPGNCAAHTLETLVVVPGSCPQASELSLILSPVATDRLTASLELVYQGLTAAEFEWTFGDGRSETTTEPRITHHYKRAPGDPKTYQLRVEAKGSGSCETQIFDDEITVPGICSEILDIVQEVLPGEDLLHTVKFTVRFKPGTPPAENFHWSWSDSEDKIDSTTASVIRSFERIAGDPRQVTLVVNTAGPDSCQTSSETQLTVPGICPEVSAFELIKETTTETHQAVLATISLVKAEAAEFIWNWGDGSQPETTLSPEASHEYKREAGDARTYTVKVIVKGPGACQSPATSQIAIGGVCPEFTELRLGLAEQAGERQTVMAKALMDRAGTTEFVWDWGDGSTPQKIRKNELSHVYDRELGDGKSYTITVTAQGPGSCTASTSKGVFIPGICPEIDSLAFEQTGMNHQGVDFSFQVNLKREGFTSFLWHWGEEIPPEETTVPTASHTFTRVSGQEKVYLVKVTASGPGNCTSTSITNITIPGVCPEIIDIDLTYDQLQATSQQMTVELSLEHGEPTEFIWGWGDNTIETLTTPTATHVYQRSPGDDDSYSISVMAKGPGDCKAKAGIQVSIPGICPQILSFDLALETTEGYETQTIQASLGVDYPEGVSYLWNWDDSSPLQTTMIPSATHSYLRPAGDGIAKTVMVTLSGPEGCACSAANNIEIPGYCPEFSDPTITYQEPTEEAQVVSIQVSTAQGTFDSITWDWGDSSTPITVSGEDKEVQSHSYNRLAGDPKEYTILISATGPGNDCATDLSIPVEVTGFCPLPIGGLQVIEAIELSPTQFQLTLTAETEKASPDSYLWNWGDHEGEIKGTSQETHIFERRPGQDQSYQIQVSLVGPDSCHAVLTTEVEVPGFCLKIVSISVDYAEVAALEQSVHVALDMAPPLSSLEYPATYHWTWGDRLEDIEPEVTDVPFANHVFARKPGDDREYTIQLEVKGPGSCSDIASVSALVSGICPVLEEVIIANSDQTLESQTIEVMVITSDATPSSYVIDWGDDSAVESFDEVPFSHSYQRYPGADRSYSVSIQLLGPGQSGKCDIAITDSISIPGYCPEITDIEIITSAEQQGGSQLVTAKAISVQGVSEQFEWNWGDDSAPETTDSPEASHEYIRLPGGPLSYHIEVVGSLPDQCQTQANTSVEIQGKCPELLDWKAVKIGEDADSVTYRFSIEVEDAELIPPGLFTYLWAWNDHHTEPAPEESRLPWATHTFKRPTQDKVITVDFWLKGPAACSRKGCVRVRVEGTCPVIESVSYDFCELTETEASIIFHARLRETPPSEQPDSYIWIWGDGSVTTVTDQPYAVHTFPRSLDQSAAYTVRVIATGGGCSCQAEYELTVALPANCPMVTDIRVIYGAQTEDYQRVTLMALTRGGIPAEYVWSFGDESISQKTTSGSVDHDFPRTQEKFLVSVAIKGNATSYSGKSCSHQLSHEVAIPLPLIISE